MNLIAQYPHAFIFIASFLLNIPCGYFRENFPKFSGKWILWIHASIPVLVYLRVQLDVSSWYAPLVISFAILGQIVGSKKRREVLGESGVELREQIFDSALKCDTPKKVAAPELMVALLNMGGPRKKEDIKKFQEYLFRDPLLIRFPLSNLLQDFFAWVLIKVRLKSVIETYEIMGGGSPIYKSTTAQAKALRAELEQRGLGDVCVTFSFNYSPPYSVDTINKAKKLNKKYFLPLSLYPHFSKATTGSNVHYLKKAAKEQYPTLNFLESHEYYTHEGYIQAFVDRIYETFESGESLDDYYILFSAHGLPLYFLTEGDPYPFQIVETVGRIASKLNRKDRWTLSYQSAVGPLQWLKPSTEDMLKALARRGVKKLLVVPVSFVGDHIETICEIDDEYREVAEEMGIKDYRMSKAIETHPGFINALADCVEAVVDRSIDWESVENNKTIREELQHAR